MSEKRREKGFTLVELLVAMTIFAIGILSVATMQITALQGNATANTVSVSASIGSSVLQEILAWSPGSAALAVDSTNNTWDFDPGAGTAEVVPGVGRFEAAYDIDRDYNGVPNVVRIEVRVRGGSGKLGFQAGRVTRLVGFKRLI